MLPVPTGSETVGQGDVHAVGGRKVGAVVLSVFAHQIVIDDVHAFGFGVGRATGVYEISSQAPMPVEPVVDYYGQVVASVESRIEPFCRTKFGETASAASYGITDPTGEFASVLFQHEIQTVVIAFPMYHIVFYVVDLREEIKYGT